MFFVFFKRIDGRINFKLIKMGVDGGGERRGGGERVEVSFLWVVWVWFSFYFGVM